MEKAKILIVDDKEKNIKLLKSMLHSENYQIMEALNGEEALKQVDCFNPDLILLDILMQGIDGFEVCRQIKQNEKTKMIPIVMVTALREREHRIKALEAGADDFLSKPVDSTELLARTKSLLRIKSFHDELLDSYRDISEKNEKLLELEKIKEGLTHMIIHDLRSPLYAIFGFIDIMLLDRHSLAENQVGVLENCICSCQDLKEMVEGLLVIHQMEEGKLQINAAATNMAAVIEETIDQFLLKAEEKQVSLSFHRPDRTHLIPVDLSLVKRIIANLLNNAIRHTPSGGAIEIRAEPSQNNGNFHVSVKDSGDGLAPEFHQKVFDKFEQVNLKQRGVNIGASGLGLAFCKLAVEAHGGKIWVESEGEGQGSNFLFTLPLNPGY